LHHREDEGDALLRIERAEHLLLVGDGDVVDREVRGDEIGERAGLADALSRSRSSAMRLTFARM
jgi:hypothetical protein